MAAYADLSSLVKSLEDLICNNRYPNSYLSGLPIVKSLHEKLKSLQELLEDYSSKGDEEADHVESEIRDMVYHVQDVIELEIYHEIHPERPHPIKNIFSMLFSCLKCGMQRQKRSSEFMQEPHLQAAQRIRLTQELLQAVEQISPIMEQLMTIKEKQRIKYLDCHSHETDHASESSSIGQNTIVGFDRYLTTIKDQLCGQSSQLQVIPITGIGGIGKTTIARTIFNDPLILHQFDYRGWITISQDYVVKRVLQNLTKSLGMTSNNMLGEDERDIKESIYKYLKGRRFLIIIDDIWSSQVWDDLKWLFPDDHYGSRIVLTSRLVDVATYSATSGNHHAIQFLNNDDSWNLLREKIFAGERCPFELETIGKFIAKKCQGLPLAIVVTAGILSNARTQNSWMRVATNLSSILNENEDGLSSILSLSYNHMPQKLKACFLYIGSFPEDFEIRISRLILLWISEDLIELSDGSKSLDNVAEEYLQDLVNRNLVLVNKKKSSGSFKFCSVHDLIRDFCRQKAWHEDFIHVITQEGDPWPRNAHRLNLHCYSDNWPSSNTSVLVRSIIRCHKRLHNSNAFGGFKLLRILDLHVSSFSESLEIVGQLCHLRYLALGFAGALGGLILRSISNLQNLQTFIVLDGWIIFLDEIWMMPRLRHLKIGRMSLPFISFVATGRVLEYLQTLSVVVDFIFTDEAIRMIPNLLKLKMECSKSGINQWNSYHLYNLIHLHRLKKLSIYFTMKDMMESLPPNFSFPFNLTKLCLQGCTLPWKDLTMVGSLPNLQVLKLRENAVTGKEWEPVEGEFCSLKFLLLERLDLEQWLADNIHFPCLEHLVIRFCYDLEEIPLEIGDIPTLKVIEVRHASKGVAKSAMRIQEEQLELGNDDIQVHVSRVGYEFNSDGADESESSN